MVEGALIILICVIIGFMCFTMLIVSKLMFSEHGINIIVKQEFSESDRQLLEDLYNEKGDIKNEDADFQEALDDVVKSINNIMLDNKEDSDE